MGNRYLFILTFIIIAAMVVIIRKAATKKKDLREFDERQLIARNECFQFGFFTFMVTNFICAFLHIYNVKWCQPSVDFFLCIFVGLGAFACSAIQKDAFVSLTQAGSRHIILYVLISVLQFVCAFMERKEMMVDGQLGLHSIAIMCGVLFMIISIMLIIRSIKEKAEMED